MTEPLEAYEEDIREISSDIKKIVKLIGKNPVPKNFRDAIQKSDALRDQYETAMEFGDIEKVSDAAKMFAVYAQLAYQSLNTMKDNPAEIVALSKSLEERSNRLRNFAENNPGTFKPLSGEEAEIERESEAQMAMQAHAQRRTRRLMEELDRHAQRNQSMLADSQEKFAALEDRISKLDSVAMEKIDRIETTYTAATENFQNKDKEINEILSLISGKAIAGDYTTSAKDERAMANWLRNASLACMLLIAGVLTYTLWDTTRATFSWEKSAVRILAAIFLSAPPRTSPENHPNTGSSNIYICKHPLT